MQKPMTFGEVVVPYGDTLDSDYRNKTFVARGIWPRKKNPFSLIVQITKLLLPGEAFVFMFDLNSKLNVQPVCILFWKLLLLLLIMILVPLFLFYFLLPVPLFFILLQLPLWICVCC